VAERATAIVLGGENPSGVTKILKKFFKDKEKVDLKAGVVGDQALTREQLLELAELPGLDELRAQLLSLLTQPATGIVQVLSAVPRDMVQVLQAKVDDAS